MRVDADDYINRITVEFKYIQREKYEYVATDINRITVEFKCSCNSRKRGRHSILIESQWNLNQEILDELTEEAKRY